LGGCDELSTPPYYYGQPCSTSVISAGPVLRTAMFRSHPPFIQSSQTNRQLGRPATALSVGPQCMPPPGGYHSPLTTEPIRHATYMRRVKINGGTATLFFVVPPANTNRKPSSDFSADKEADCLLCRPGLFRPNSTHADEIPEKPPHRENTNYKKKRPCIRGWNHLPRTSTTYGSGEGVLRPSHPPWP